MPEHTPYTLGPLASMQIGAASEMGGVIACLYAGDQGAFEQIVGPLAPPQVETLYFEVDPGNTEVAGAMWVQPGHLYLAFGGTHAWHQWPRHGTGALSAPYLDAQGAQVAGVAVHGFHQVVARRMWDLMRPFFPADWESRELRVTGHSLGGSVAQLIAWRLAQLGHGARTQTITFGAPRCILGYYQGARPAAEYRVTNIDDIVPHLPPPYTTVVVEGIQALMMIRSGRPKGDQGLKDTEGASGLNRWLHYGDNYSVSVPGGIDVFRGDTDKGIPGPWHQVALKSATTHRMPAYLARQEAAGFRYGQPLQAFQAIDIGRIAMADPANPVPEITIDPRTGADIVYSNAQLLPAPSQPLTMGNAGSTQGMFNRFFAIGLDDSVLNGEVLGGDTVAMWDLTVLVNNDVYGTSNTVALDGATEAQARSAVLEFAFRRAKLLGNDKDADPIVYMAISQGRSSPAVEYARIRDAQNPRVGDVFPVPSNKGLPYKSTSSAAAKLANAADPMFVSVNLSLRATAGAVVKRAILKITGVPDKVVALGGYDGTLNVGASAIPFETHLRSLVDWLTSPTGLSLGISGLSPAAEKVITAWTPDVATGRAKATIAGHGYSEGDQIRITRTKWWYLNRTWEIEVPDANTIILKRSQMTTAQVPTSNGRANRAVLANGTKVVTFYRFDRPSWMDGSPLPPLPVRITRKRPGAKFDPVSFRAARKAVKR